MSDACIQIRNLRFSYPQGPVILESVSMSVMQGDFVALIGPNGGGKTTLLKLMLGLLKPQQGSVEVLGLCPQRARARLGYVPQFSSHVHDFPITVHQLVAQGRLNKGPHNYWLTPEDKHVISQALEATDTQGLSKHPVSQLSGGQKQRVLVARALASQPDILLLDEPTAHVDNPSELQIFDLLAELNRQMTMLVVSHDLGVVSRYVNKAACVNRSLHWHPVDHLDASALQASYPYSIQNLNADQRAE